MTFCPLAVYGHKFNNMNKDINKKSDKKKCRQKPEQE